MGKPEKTKLVAFRVRESVHRKLRLRVAREDITLQAFAEAAILDRLDKPYYVDDKPEQAAS